MPNRLLERRLPAIELETVEIGDLGSSSLAAELVANAIEDRLPQIRLKRTDAAGLEALDPLKRLDQGVLDKVVGVSQIARPPGQSPAGPALERLEMAGEQPLQCLAVPCARAVDQTKGRLWTVAIRRSRVRCLRRSGGVFRHEGSSQCNSERILPEPNATSVSRPRGMRFAQAPPRRSSGFLRHDVYLTDNEERLGRPLSALRRAHLSTTVRSFLS